MSFKIRDYEVPESVQDRLKNFVSRRSIGHYLVHHSLCLVRNIINGVPHVFYSPSRFFDKKISVDKKCFSCNGRGFLKYTGLDGSVVKVVCYRCDGEGHYVSNVDACRRCKGKGFLEKEDVDKGLVKVVCDGCDGTGELSEWDSLDMS